MDTIIVRNQFYPMKIDSIKVNSDFSLIVKELDSVKMQNQRDFNKLGQTILVSSKKEQFLKSVSNDALFTTITTILVFSLGVLINIFIKWLDRLKKRKETRAFIKHHLDKIINSYSTILQKAYSDFSKNTTIDSGILLTPPKILSNDFQRILHLDSRELFNSIKEKKELSSIVSQVDFLNNLLPEVQSYHEKALKRSDSFREKLNIDLNIYMDSLADFVEYEKNNTLEYESTEPYKIINDSILKFYKEISGKRELQKFYDEILRLNQEYLVKSDLFRTHSIGKIISQQGKDLSHLFNDLKGLTDEFKEQYSEFSKLVKTSFDSMKNNVGKINWE